MAINVVLIVFDILWMSTTGSSWGDNYSAYPLWNSMSGMRAFAMTFSVFNLILKVFCLGFFNDVIGHLHWIPLHVTKRTC